MEIKYRPIGVIHTPFADIAGMPVQPVGAAGIQGRIELLDEYADGLEDLEGFSHIYLLYHFHRVRESVLRVMPFLDTQERGVFATRAPKRPNPIGLSVVRLVEIEGRVLHVEGVDILDGTPLLDIKPYVPKFDVYAAERVGWLEGAEDRVARQRSDDRFK